MNRSPNCNDKIITLDRGYYTTCTLNLFGGRITSWRIKNTEQLFFSRNTIFNSLNRIHGGISLSFPEVGDWEFGDTDGFVKSIKWTVQKMPTKLENGEDIEAIFITEQCAYTKSMYNYDFRIALRVVLRDKALEMDWEFLNTDKVFPLPFKFCVHSYLRIPNLTEVAVRGLANCVRMTGAEEEVIVDQSYFEGAENFCIPTPECFLIENTIKGGCISVYSKNLPEMSIWNGVRKEMGLMEDEKFRFLSVGCGIISEQYLLKSNDKYTASLTLRWGPKEQDFDADQLKRSHEYVNGVLFDFKT